ncbi:MAG TPA: hypothetical protein PLZ36_18920, partial [Armatimonadota bacterium]|nr:hypothetical protein [Armatimonadota bacterium]
EMFGPPNDPRGLDRVSVARSWERYEAASRHCFTFEVRRDAAGIEYWIDGRYAGRRDNAAALTGIGFLLPAGGAVKDAATGTLKQAGGFLPLDITALANPGVMAAAVLPLKSGPQVVKGIPLHVAPAAANLDLGAVRENLGSYWLECDGYLSRSAFSGMPESLMLSVPNAQYRKAYVLCAVADDPARDPILTVRLTRFLSAGAGGRGPAIADTTVALPRAAVGKLPPGVTALGQVAYTVDGQPRTAPLYLVDVPIDCGSIQDVIFEEKSFAMIPQPYLDIEVLGKCDRALQQMNRAHKPDPTSTSAVHVFGITLVKSPVELEVVPAREGNAYYTHEQAAMTAVLRAREKASCRLRWEVRDVDGKVVDAGETRRRFVEPGEERVAVKPNVNDVGLYTLHFHLLDDEQGPLVAHRATMALVAPDTRAAGYASPYFTWWFNGAHLTSSDITVVGPLLKMAGIRRTLVKDEAVGEPWTLTIGQIGSFAGAVPPDQLAAKTAEYAKKINDAMKAFPHADAANIF